MMRFPFRSSLLALLLLAGSGAVPARAALSALRLGDDDRLLILAPHPDDETLAAGGLIQEALALDLPVRVGFFTMGDNNEIAYLFTRKHPEQMPGAVRAMGTLRQNEALAAATQLGLATNDLVFLGYPDSGTLQIWKHHWREIPPYRSPLTRANAVPYDRALTPGSAYAGEDILDDLDEVLRDFQPTLVVVPHPADHNVDHRALYLFARVALWNLAADGIEVPHLAAPVHFTQWPEPRRYHPMRAATPPHFLAESCDWMEFVLAPFQVSNKLAAIRRHHSQYPVASAYLDSCIRKSELFGDFPDLALPGGNGSIEIAEEDVSQFRPDEDLFAELSGHSDSWNAIAAQNAAETTALADMDNGFVQRTVSSDGTDLTMSFEFEQPLAAPLALSACLFGYRADTPFGEMPKISIEVKGPGSVVVKDLSTELPEDSVELLGDGGDGLALRIPLSLLGDPEKILTGSRMAKGSLPVDWTAWRVLDLAPMLLADPSAPIPKPEAPPPPPPDPQPMPAVPAVELTASEPPPPDKPAPLTPRVDLPRRAIPDRTEANEPVMW